MQLMVLGMHRSGTSVLARLLNLMGVYFGPEGISTGANQENPKGFWERRDVRALNDHVLHSVGCDWNKVLEFDPAALPAALVSEFEKRAARLVLEMDAHRPWMMKEPRLSLLFPLWHKMLDLPVCIRILRNPVEVASSLLTRNNIPIQAGLALWERYVRLEAHATEGVPGIIVSHRQLMQQPVEAAKALFDGLLSLEIPDIRLPSSVEINSFVSADLYRERDSKPTLSAHAEAPQVKLYEFLLSGKVPSESPMTLSSGCKEVLARYESRLPDVVRPADVPVPKKPEQVLREKLDARDGEVAELRERLQEEMRGAMERIAMMDAASQASARHVAAVERDLQRRDSEIREMAERFAAASDRIADLEQRLEKERERAADSARMAQELGAASGRIGELEQQLEKEHNRAGDVARLAEELSRTNENARLLERKVAQRFSEVERLTRLLMDAEARLEQAEAQGRKLQQDITKKEANANAALASAQLEAARLRDRIAGMERTVASKNDDIEAGKRALDTARLELRTTRSALARCQKEKSRRAVALSRKSAEANASDRKLRGATSALTWRATSALRWIGRILAGRPAMGQEDTETLEAIRRSGMFDDQWYLDENADVLESRVDPLRHYLEHGACEGRNPGAAFDTRFYLDTNIDVAESGMNPLLHYIRYGAVEGRRPGPGRTRD